LETLRKIRHIVNVTDLLKQHEKAKLATRAALREADAKAAAELPPSNDQPPLPVAVSRKTEVVDVRFEMTPEDEAVVAVLPVKAQSYALKLLASGELSQIRQGLAAGINALKNKPGYLQVTVDCLISGGFTRAELREAMRERLGWADTSAGPHVSLAIALFKAFGLVQENDGRLVVVPVVA
jgi:hypothetical protein